MGVNESALIALRAFHAVAALIWLGGGLYYLIAIRPLVGSEDAGEFARQAQLRFREWAGPATLVMLASGVILLFEGLSSSRAGLGYVATLAVKIVIALAAFWLVSIRGRRRMRASLEAAVALGMTAFVLGVLISTIWPAR